MRAPVSDDMLINVSKEVLEMLMSNTTRLAVEAVVEFAWHFIWDLLTAFLKTESMCSIAERSRSTVDSFELTDLD